MATAGPPGVTLDAASPVPLPSKTDSVASNRTLKGVALQSPSGTVPVTPSYPFPRMDGASRSPMKTPDTFVPFTALSPTRETLPIKAAKAQLAQDFKASGHMKLAMNAGRTAQQPNALPLGPPDNLKIAIDLQSEAGLKAWWGAVCQVVKEHFGAERASLAVPSDMTDIENVPWVQLAAFRGGSDDTLSRMTNERTSDRSNLTDISLPSRHQRADKKSRAVSSKSGHTPDGESPPVKSLAVHMSARPKLELRHSYAGYPIKDKVSSQDFALQPKEHLHRPRAIRANSSTAAVDQTGNVLELNEEALEKHDQALEGLEGPTSPLRPSDHAVVLDIAQSLEVEANPLIDSSGIFKVVRCGVPVLLTRHHREPTVAKVKDDGKRSQPGTPNRSKPRMPPPSARSKRHGAKSTLRTLEESPDKNSKLPAYEDFEQIPASPWSQSPAPSPAARVESGDNPFFPGSAQVDERAFDDLTPGKEGGSQGSTGYIPAIGVDKASTIIQIPLIHPRTKNIHQLDRRSTATSTFSPNPDESLHSAAVRSSNRAPQAILSLLVPIVPYPMYLYNSLAELSPLLAATFISARKHSSMLRQIESLSRKRRSAYGIMSELSFQTDSDLSRNQEYSPADTFAEASQNFSPLSAESSNEPSRPTSATSERLILDRSHQVVTPGFVPISSKHSGGRRTPGTPSVTMEPSGSYFTSKEPEKDHSTLPTSEPATTNTTVSAKVNAVRNIGSKDSTAKARLHSQGATFAATHPALPTATSARVGPRVQPTGASINEEGKRSEDSELNLPSLPNVKPSVSMLQTMIDNGAAQQWVAAGSDGMVLWANAKFLVYRQSKGEDLDADFWESIDMKDRQSFRLAWSNALQTGEQFARSCRLRRFNGDKRWFSIRIIPIKDRHGATKFFHGQAMDIHEQRKAERSAHKAEEHKKYRTLADSIPVIVFAAHVPTGITYANSQWLSYSGQTEDGYKGFGFLDHVHPDDLVKCRFPGFDGNPFPQNETSVRQPLYRHDSSTSNASSNAESEGTAVTDSTAIPGKSGLSDDLDPLYPSALLRQLADEGVVACIKDGQGNLSITTEMRLKSKTGEYRWHVVSGSYIDSVDFGSGDAPAQWFLTATDITSQKQTESRIEEAKLALENANSKLASEVKSKMAHLSSMSHEIRTPLNGIIGNLQFLINSGLAEEANEWAYGAKEAATNMSELINDILDLSKAEAGMLNLSSHIFSPRELVENVLDQLNSKAAERDLELCVEVDPRVPSNLRGDSGRMRQILLNLVGNALKFTLKGEIWITCDLLTTARFDLPKLADNERFVQWTICDTGKGFTEADKDYLFKEYSQIKKRRDRDIGGTGLGLILCKTMVELHGGKIEASGEPGKGASFNFFARFKVPKARSKTYTPNRKVGGRAAATASGNREPPSPAKTTMSSPLRSTLGSLVSTPASASSVESFNTTIAPTASSKTGHPIPSHVSNPVASPTISSGGSSALSTMSTHFAQSIRSSSSVSSSDTKAAAMTLTLPDKDGKSSIVTLDSPMSPQHMRAISEGLTPGIEGVTFRPPMYSVLLYCPVSNANRITADQIKYVVPKSVPCHLKAEVEEDVALDLLSGADALTFTHVVIRTTNDEDAVSFVDKVLKSDTHQHTCLVLITSQAQLKSITDLRPELDIKSHKKKEKLLILQRPCHTYKLARVFDPLRENEATAEDPQAAKRREEKRMQQESYAMFRRELGGRKLRVLAVEDSKVQMNVLANFLSKICGVEVVKTYDGRECLETMKSFEPDYFSAIVSDIEMPIMGGYEMVKQLREWEKTTGRSPTPTVSLSANTVKEGWVASADAGFTHFTPKPINFINLGNVLCEITQPGHPHVFLRDRPLPKELSREKQVDSSDEESEGEEDSE